MPLALLLLATGCDGQAGEDPRDVARAFWEASFHCGEDGVGRMHELLLRPTEPSAALLSAEDAAGCRPQPVPEADAFLLVHRRDVAIVELRVAGAPARRFRLLRTPDGWRVDGGGS